MKKNFLFILVMFLFVALGSWAQDDYNARAKKYVEQYAPLAIAEQRRSGIPASITLGQGILETEAGISELMTQANNHFGIKCKNGWNGEVFLHTDDAPNEKFKKYRSAQDSYKDHSDHLKNNERYSPLFKLQETDYASWAKCLKRCGYATNPQYAQKLIKIIEDFKLQEYTYEALRNDEPADYKIIPASYVMPDTPKKPVAARALKKTDTVIKVVVHQEEPNNKQGGVVVESSDITLVNGLKAIFVNKGEKLQSYADKYHIPYPQLLLLNDLPDAPLPADMNVYLEPKLTIGTHPIHILTQGETLLTVAQAEGMQMKSLQALNLLNANEEPLSGTILELEKTATQKPGVKISEIAAHPANAIVMPADGTPKPVGDYIPVAKTATAPPVEQQRASAAITILTPAAAPDTTKAPPASATVAPAKPARNPVHESPIAPPKRVKKNQWEMTDEEVEAESAKKAEFSKLKGELDKIVYADDSKLATKNEVTPQPQKKPITENIPASKSNKYYTVKKGDTAFSIAKKNNITVSQLLQWNGISAGDIKEGQSVQVKEK